jgi:CDP-glucose 4,6-dehydratase
MYGDSTRARHVLGWRPRIGLDEGLNLTIDWYRQYLRHGGGVIQ